MNCGPSFKKNSTKDDGVDGAVWVWAAIDTKTRLLIYAMTGGRTLECCRSFLEEVVDRLNDGKPFFTSDELCSYATVLKELYHEMHEFERTGKAGRPKNPVAVVDEGLDYATVRKERVNGEIVKVERQVVYGMLDRIMARLIDTPSNTINTSFIERLNGTLRQLNSHLRRKANTFAKAIRYFKAKIHLTAAMYNFCRPHGTLSRNPDKTTTQRTPAMAAGITGHIWGAVELLGFPVVCNE